MPKTGGLDLIRLARKLRPATPIFLLQGAGQKRAFSDYEMRRLAIQGIVQKDHLAEGVKSVFDSCGQEIFRHTRAAGHASVSDDRQYIAVPATDFLTGTPSSFDIYLSLPSGRYLRLVEAKETFPPQRALDYISKGVTHFYLSRSGQEKNLTYCNLLSGSLPGNPGVSFEVKATHAFNQAQRVIEITKQEGVTAGAFDQAQEFLTGVEGLIEDYKLDRETAIRGVLENARFYDHAVAICIFAGLLTVPLRIETSESVRTVGLASLFHDVGLYQLGLAHENATQMNEDERKKFAEHAAIGAKVLENNDLFDPVCAQAVAQHHLRRNQAGSPEIQPIAELIGISEEFCGLLSKRGYRLNRLCLREMEDRYFDGYSAQTIEAFRFVFGSA
jgi:hypothetical protein